MRDARLTVTASLSVGVASLAVVVFPTTAALPLADIIKRFIFFIDESGKVFVREGSWFSDLPEFKDHVEKEYALSGTFHIKKYLAACDFAEMILRNNV